MGNDFDVLRMEISDKCWRQASFWTAKKIRRQRIRGIIRRRSESNARGACRIIEVTQQAVSVWLRAMGMIQKQGNWMSYELKPKDVERQFFTCEQLIQRQQRKDFLHRIVTEDEKWIFYDNPKKKKYCVKFDQSLLSTSISTPRPNIHGSKIMYLVGPKGSCLLWAAEIWRFHYGWSVSATNCNR